MTGAWTTVLVILAVTCANAAPVKKPVPPCVTKSTMVTCDCGNKCTVALMATPTFEGPRLTWSCLGRVKGSPPLPACDPLCETVVVLKPNQSINVTHTGRLFVNDVQTCPWCSKTRVRCGMNS